jgi:REP element-mobilizing transposase RayT
VEHRTREEVDDHDPVHVTLRVRADVPCLRQRRPWATIVQVFRDARDRGALLLVHYVVLSNHLHLILEITEAMSLEAVMRGLTTSLARRLNKCFGRRGRLFDGRYHARALTSPLEVRHALAYVLLNSRKHAAEEGERLPADWIDDRSSAVTFDGWSREIDSRFASHDFGTVRPRTWLLREG